MIFRGNSRGRGRGNYSNVPPNDDLRERQRNYGRGGYNNVPPHDDLREQQRNYCRPGPPGRGGPPRGGPPGRGGPGRGGGPPGRGGYSGRGGHFDQHQRNPYERDFHRSDPRNYQQNQNYDQSGRNNFEPDHAQTQQKAPEPPPVLLGEFKPSEVREQTLSGRIYNLHSVRKTVFFSISILFDNFENHG